MNQSRSLSELSVSELRKVLQLKEEIATLETQLNAVLGGAPSSSAAPAKRRGRPPGSGRKMSPAARARIGAAQKARWASKKGDATPAAEAKPAGKRGGRRKMSADARARIAAAQKARWAAKRSGAAAPAAPKVAKVKGKRGGRRQLSPEARARIAAAQKARWAARKAK
jgi:hypothetical protein